MPDATTSLAVLVADTSFVTSLAEAVIAEERSSTARLQPAVAGRTQLQPDVSVAIADALEAFVTLDALVSGSLYLTGSMSLGVAEEMNFSAIADIVIAERYSLTPDLQVLITDAIAIVLEANDPPFAPLVTMTDLLLGIHPNVITSPTTNFAQLGVSGGDVLQVYDGPNAAHYIIQQVDGNALFVGEAFISPTATGPWSGEVRVQRDKIAQTTAALVLDQALFFAPTVRIASLDMVVS